MYLSSTRIVSPGITLATFIVKTLGRLCSSSDALFPSFFAASNSVFACSRSLIFATIRTSPIVIVMPETAARVEAGNT